jgi:hypothetical protein
MEQLLHAGILATHLAHPIHRAKDLARLGPRRLRARRSLTG